MECKGGIHTGSKWNVVVLIETLWNVKSISIRFGLNVLSVLIETLWNVKNPAGNRVGDCAVRINRNIVECKGILDTFLLVRRIVLIETLWNVKFF